MAPRIICQEKMAENGIGLSCFCCICALIFLGSIGVFPYIAIDLCNWLNDFQDWNDEIDGIVNDDYVTCTDKSKSSSLVNDTDTFVTITLRYFIFNLFHSVCRLIVRTDEKIIGQTNHFFTTIKPKSKHIYNFTPLNTFV